MLHMEYSSPSVIAVGIDEGTCRGGDDCAHLVGGYCDSTTNTCKCGAAYGTVVTNVCQGLGKRAVYMNYLSKQRFYKRQILVIFFPRVLLHIQYFLV